MYYDIDSYILLENEKGDLIELCKPIANTENIDSNKYLDIGMRPPANTYTAKQLRGYALHEKVSTIAVNGSQLMTGKQFKVYLNARTFNPSMLTSNSLLAVNNRYYQLEIVEEIFHRGKVVYYAGNLKENDRTQPSINIVSRTKLDRKYANQHY